MYASAAHGLVEDQELSAPTNLLRKNRLGGFLQNKERTEVMGTMNSEMAASTSHHEEQV